MDVPGLNVCGEDHMLIWYQDFIKCPMCKFKAESDNFEKVAHSVIDSLTMRLNESKEQRRRLQERCICGQLSQEKA